MKTFFSITLATAFMIAASNAQTPSTSTNTAAASEAAGKTTSENVGTITELTPGSEIVLSTGSGEPIHYKFAKSVTYVNARGKEINAAKIKKDRKVRVHYVKEGNDMLVDKVTVVKD